MMRSIFVLAMMAATAFAQPSRHQIERKVSSPYKAFVLELPAELVTPQSLVEWEPRVPMDHELITFAKMPGVCVTTLGNQKRVIIQGEITTYDAVARDAGKFPWTKNVYQFVITIGKPNPGPEPDIDTDFEPDVDPVPPDDGELPDLPVKFGVGPHIYQSVKTNVKDFRPIPLLVENFEYEIGLLKKDASLLESTFQRLAKKNAPVFSQPGWSKVEADLESWFRSPKTTPVRSVSEHRLAFKELVEWLKAIDR